MFVLCKWFLIEWAIAPENLRWIISFSNTWVNVPHFPFLNYLLFGTKENGSPGNQESGAANGSVFQNSSKYIVAFLEQFLYPLGNFYLFCTSSKKRPKLPNNRIIIRDVVADGKSYTWPKIPFARRAGRKFPRRQA